MTLTDVGTGTSSLHCVTDSLYCCRRTNSSSGYWYYPNGTQIPNLAIQSANPSGISDSPYYVTRDFGQVLLQRNHDGTTTGIFRCDIPVATGATQTFYVGIYRTNTGESKPEVIMFYSQHACAFEFIYMVSINGLFFIGGGTYNLC